MILEVENTDTAPSVVAFWEVYNKFLVTLIDEASSAKKCRSTCKMVAERCRSLQKMLETFTTTASLAQSSEAVTSWGKLKPTLELVQVRLAEANSVRDYIDAMRKKKVKKALLDSLSDLDTALADQCRLLAKVASSRTPAPSPGANGKPGTFSIEEHVRSLLIQAQLGGAEEHQEAVRGLASLTDSNTGAQRVVLMEGGLRPIVGILGGVASATPAGQAQEHAVTVLQHIAEGSPTGASAIAGQQAAVSSLVKVVQAGTPAAQSGAAGVLWAVAQSDSEAKASIAEEAKGTELVKLLKRIFPDDFIFGESKKEVEQSYQASLAGLLAQAEKDRAAVEQKLLAARAAAQKHEEELLAQIRGLETALAKEREEGACALKSARSETEGEVSKLQRQLEETVARAEKQKLETEKQLTKAALPALNDVESLRSVAERRDIILLVLVLHGGTSEAKCKAAGILGDLAQGDAGNCRTISAYGGIAPLVDTLRSPDVEVAENGSGALLALSVDPTSRKEIIKHGAIPLLQRFFEAGSEDAKETAAALLWTLAEDENGKKLIRQESGMVSVLRDMASGSKQGGREIAVKALSAICEGLGSDIR